MTTKQKVKREIDSLPEELLKEVYEFLSNLKSGKKKQGKLRSVKLKGKLDKLNIRKEAYE